MRDKAFVDTNIWLYALFTNATEELRSTQAKQFLSGLVLPSLSN